MPLKENDEVFDYYQEVARSGFADMLHDTERNHKYSIAIRESIESMHRKGKKAKVLDIGTGTGLLAMLGALHGADSVVTIEAFSPVSHIAREIIEKNGFKNHIKIINKHSTEVTVGKGKDIEQKANILVAEVFDTELIGEGAIKTYNQAHKNLMEKDCICIPDSASIFVQIVDCPSVIKWNSFLPLDFLGECAVKCPENVSKCSGIPAVHDLQLSQISLKSFKTLGGPLRICNFDFSGSTVIETNEKLSKTFLAAANGEANAVFFWWELKMNPSGTILLSCAPHWSHPDSDVLSNFSDEVIRRNAIPWRDHWMQGCFYLNSLLNLEKDKPAVVTAYHDEFSWWFDVRTESDNDLTIERPMCSCLFHITNSRNRTIQMNSNTDILSHIMNFKQGQEKCLLFVGDHNVWALASDMFQKNVKTFLLQEEPLCFKSLQNFVKYNQSTVQLISDLKEIGSEIITDVISEPHFNSSTLPWDNFLIFWKHIKQLKNYQGKEFTIMPYGARICAIPVKFLNLHKIRWPLSSTCEGFNHELFDEFVENASLMADENVEPFSLWEYPCVALGKSKSVFELCFNSNKAENFETILNIEESPESCNGIAFWVEINLSSEEGFMSRSSYGPASEIKIGELISWPLEYRQGVHLIKSSDVGSGIKSIKVSTGFDEANDKLVLDFSYS